MTNEELPSIDEVSPGSFIYRQDRALSAAFCDGVIQRFEADEANQYKGLVGQAMSRDPDLKNTTDIAVSGNQLWRDVEVELFRSLTQSIKAFSRDQRYFLAIERFQPSGFHLQRYQAGQYYDWHVDADHPKLSSRQLVALWYLNTVDPGAGGATEFARQGISVQPLQGSLLLFPPFWTHVHRSSPLQSGTKYIATTWINFAAPER